MKQVLGFLRRAILITVLLKSTIACNFNITFTEQDTIKYITKPHFDDNYLPNYFTCEYQFIAPTDYHLTISCEYNFTENYPCFTHHLLLSTSADVELKDVKKYCGNKKFQDVSSISSELYLVYASKDPAHGHFQCTIKNIKNCNCGSTISYTKTDTNNNLNFMALVLDNDNQPIILGSIITPRYILSDVSILPEKKHFELRALVGGYVFNYYNKPKSDEYSFELSDETQLRRDRLYDISFFKIHEKYDENKPTLYNIAVLKTTLAIKFTENIAPICLPFFFKNDNFLGNILFVMGYGSILNVPGFVQPNEILKVPIRVTNILDCSTSNPLTSNSNFCTYPKQVYDCSYAASGPIIYENNNRLYLIGIQYSQDICKHKYYSVDTRISFYLDWIKRNTDYEICN